MRARLVSRKFLRGTLRGAGGEAPINERQQHSELRNETAHGEAEQQPPRREQAAHGEAPKAPGRSRWAGVPGALRRRW